jgi:uncharacterized cupredoxin-like copper-binding protein
MLRRLVLLLAIVPTALGVLSISASGASAEAKPRSITIGAKDFSFDAPPSIKGGNVKVTLDNTGAETHQIDFIKLDEGTDMAAYLEASATQGLQATQDVADYRGGPNSAPAGGSTTATQVLTPGNYVIACLLPGADGIPHVAKGMIQPITVEKPGKQADQKAPKTTKIGLKNYQFDVPTSFEGDGTLAITNNSSDELHELVVGKLKDGQTIQDVITWGSQPLFQPWTLPQPYDDIGGITGISPGNKERIKLSNLEPGDYGFFCFLPNDEDVSHVQLGMVYPFTVK